MRTTNDQNHAILTTLFMVQGIDQPATMATRLLELEPVDSVPALRMLGFGKVEAEVLMGTFENVVDAIEANMPAPMPSPKKSTKPARKAPRMDATMADGVWNRNGEDEHVSVLDDTQDNVSE